MHLDLLHETGSLGKEDYNSLTRGYDKLGRKINSFLQSVIKGHEPGGGPKTAREPGVEYDCLFDLDLDAPCIAGDE